MNGKPQDYGQAAFREGHQNIAIGVASDLPGNTANVAGDKGAVSRAGMDAKKRVLGDIRKQNIAFGKSGNFFGIETLIGRTTGDREADK